MKHNVPIYIDDDGDNYIKCLKCNGPIDISDAGNNYWRKCMYCETYNISKLLYCWRKLLYHWHEHICFWNPIIFRRKTQDLITETLKDLPQGCMQDAFDEAEKIYKNEKELRKNA